MPTKRLSMRRIHRLMTLSSIRSVSRSSISTLLEKVMAFSEVYPANSSSELACSAPVSSARNTVSGLTAGRGPALPNRSEIAPSFGSEGNLPVGHLPDHQNSIRSTRPASTSVAQSLDQ